jgi:hypothetical protein
MELWGMVNSMVEEVPPAYVSVPFAGPVVSLLVDSTAVTLRLYLILIRNTHELAHFFFFFIFCFQQTLQIDAFLPSFLFCSSTFLNISATASWRR